MTELYIVYHSGVDSYNNSYIGHIFGVLTDPNIANDVGMELGVTVDELTANVFIPGDKMTYETAIKIHDILKGV